MAVEAIDIAELVKTVVEPLVEFPDDIEVTGTLRDDESLFVEIRSHADDVGKIIGRQGRTIKSIRVLARAAGSRIGTAVDVEIID